MFGCEALPEEGVCDLLGAGPLYDYTIQKRPQDLLIAADGGYTHARRMNLEADILLGDFDSLGHIPKADHCLVLPQEKDDTYMLAAARVGLEKGYRYFCLLGGTGGRMDHTLANIQLLAFLEKQGARGWLMAEQNVLTLLGGPGELRLAAGLKGYLSVLAYGGAAQGVSLEGLKYPLQDAVLTPDFPLGTSNEFIGVPARIALELGRVLLIYPRWQEAAE